MRLKDSHESQKQTRWGHGSGCLPGRRLCALRSLVLPFLMYNREIVFSSTQRRTSKVYDILWVVPSLRVDAPGATAADCTRRWPVTARGLVSDSVADRADRMCAATIQARQLVDVLRTTQSASGHPRPAVEGFASHLVPTVPAGGVGCSQLRVDGGLFVHRGQSNRGGLHVGDHGGVDSTGPLHPTLEQRRAVPLGCRSPDVPDLLDLPLPKQPQGLLERIGLQRAEKTEIVRTHSLCIQSESLGENSEAFEVITKKLLQGDNFFPVVTKKVQLQIIPLEESLAV